MKGNSTAPKRIETSWLVEKKRVKARTHPRALQAK